MLPRRTPGESAHEESVTSRRTKGVRERSAREGPPLQAILKLQWLQTHVARGAIYPFGARQAFAGPASASVFLLYAAEGSSPPLFVSVACRSTA